MHRRLQLSTLAEFICLPQLFRLGALVPRCVTKHQQWAAISGLALFAWFVILPVGSAQAACTQMGNNLVCACDGTTVTEKLCRGTGSVCDDPAVTTLNPTTATSSPQDNLQFTIPAGGATIMYTITSPQVTIAGATQLTGSGEINNPNPSPPNPADQPFNATIGG